MNQHNLKKSPLQSVTLEDITPLPFFWTLDLNPMASILPQCWTSIVFLLLFNPQDTFCYSQIQEKQTTALSVEETSSEKTGYSLTIPAMGVRFRIVLYCETEQQAKTAFDLARRQLIELEHTFTDYDDLSEALRLSRLPAMTRFPVSQNMMDLLTKADGVRQKTDGCFDVTVGRLTKLWRQQKSLTEATKQKWKTDFDQEVQLLLNRNGPCFDLEFDKQVFQQGTNSYSLDFGGIAKGYAADVILQTLKKEMDLQQVLVDASGDITVGTAPPEKIDQAAGWVVGLSQLNPDQGIQQKLRIENYSIASSGDARQFFEDTQGRHSHLLNPKTGQAIAGKHLTVVANPHGYMADALASALSVCNDDQFQIIVDQFPGTHALRMRHTENGIETQTSNQWNQWIEAHQVAPSQPTR